MNIPDFTLKNDLKCIEIKQENLVTLSENESKDITRNKNLKLSKITLINNE